MGKPAAARPGTAVVINPDSPVISPNTKIHVAKENEKIAGEADDENIKIRRRSITTRRTAVDAAKPVKHVVLIPQFREIKPVPYNLKRSTVRRSERILDKLDHISEHGTPVRRVKRLRRQAAVKSASSNRKLFQEDEEDDGDEGMDEGEGSTQSCSEERDDEEDEMEDSTVEEDEVDESEEEDDEVDESQEEEDESLNEEEDEEEEDESSEEEEEPSCTRTLRRARFLFTTSKQQSSSSSEPKKQLPAKSKQTPSRNRSNVSVAKPFTLALSSFERKRRSELERIAYSLGMTIAADFVDDFTHVVVPKPSSKSRSASRRTMKVLSGLATGAFIVSEAWLDACRDKGEILDSVKYELTKEFPGALWRRKRGPGKGLFAGFKVLVRGNTSPSKHDLEHLVSLADGRIASSPSECDICVGPENYFREAKRMKKMFVADSALLNALQEGKLPDGISPKSRSA